jgi:hypothetical protein
MFADVYVLANERSVALVEDFLDRFLPHRAPAAADYGVPRFSEQPRLVFRDVRNLLLYCEASPRESYAVYWNSTDPYGDTQAAHVFFLEDGGMILGLSTARLNKDEPERLLGVLREFAGSSAGYISCEEPPVDSSTEFRRLASSLRPLS